MSDHSHHFVSGTVCTVCGTVLCVQCVHCTVCGTVLCPAQCVQCVVQYCVYSVYSVWYSTVSGTVCTVCGTVLCPAQCVQCVVQYGTVSGTVCTVCGTVLCPGAGLLEPSTTTILVTCGIMWCRKCYTICIYSVYISAEYWTLAESTGSKI